MLKILLIATFFFCLLIFDKITSKFCTNLLFCLILTFLYSILLYWIYSQFKLIAKIKNYNFSFLFSSFFIFFTYFHMFVNFEWFYSPITNLFYDPSFITGLGHLFGLSSIASIINFILIFGFILLDYYIILKIFKFIDKFLFMNNRSYQIGSF